MRLKKVSQSIGNHCACEERDRGTGPDVGGIRTWFPHNFPIKYSISKVLRWTGIGN